MFGLYRKTTIERRLREIERQLDIRPYPVRCKVCHELDSSDDLVIYRDDDLMRMVHLHPECIAGTKYEHMDWKQAPGRPGIIVIRG